jgi:hypothetical protein
VRRRKPVASGTRMIGAALVAFLRRLHRKTPLAPLLRSGGYPLPRHASFSDLRTSSRPVRP